MSVTETITESFTLGGPTVTKSNTLTGSRRQELDETIAIASNNPVPFACVEANIKALVISCDQDVTVKTNDSGSPHDTIPIKSGKPYVWYTGCPHTLLITADVTELFITNASASIANLQLVCLE